MSSEKTDHERERLLELAARLQRKVDGDPHFTPEDLATINEMLKAWRGWAALGRTMRWIIITLGLLAAGLTSWNAIVAAVKAWFKASIMS